MSAVLEICAKELREQMLPRVGEIGEDCWSFKATVISHSTNTFEQSRGGSTETSGLMNVSKVDRNGEQEEYEGVVDEVRRNQTCFNCGTRGYVARDCR